MYTSTINDNVLHELRNGEIAYDPSGKARAAVYGCNLILACGNVQHNFHIETSAQQLNQCWAILQELN